MLCVLSAAAGQLAEEDEQFLELIGEELGLALEKATLIDEREKADKNFKELFETRLTMPSGFRIRTVKFWMPTRPRLILPATGEKRLIGGDVIRSLNPVALELAREVRYNYSNGINVVQAV